MTKAKRTNTCQWCGDVLPTATAHMIHVTEAHPETIGRGRSMSKLWSCSWCGADNPPVIHECQGCRRPNVAVQAANEGRTFVICRRRLDGTISRSQPTTYQPARITMSLMPAIMASQHERQDVTFDARRYECRNTTGTRVAWLEVAVVTETSNYNPRSTP